MSEPVEDRKVPSNPDVNSTRDTYDPQDRTDYNEEEI